MNMKPTDFKLILNDDAIKFAEEINELLAEGYSFYDNLKIENGAFVQALVKVEPIMQVKVDSKETK